MANACFRVLQELGEDHCAWAVRSDLVLKVGCCFSSFFVYMKSRHRGIAWYTYYHRLGWKHAKPPWQWHGRCLCLTNGPVRNPMRTTRPAGKLLVAKTIPVNLGRKENRVNAACFFSQFIVLYWWLLLIMTIITADCFEPIIVHHLIAALFIDIDRRISSLAFPKIIHQGGNKNPKSLSIPPLMHLSTTPCPISLSKSGVA